MRMKASYTVEAAVVMGMVLVALMVLIKTGIQWETTVAGTMKLHETAEYVRGQEEEKQINLADYGISVWVRGKQVIGHWKKNGQSLTIELKRYEPEEFIRFVSLATEWEWE